MNNKKYRRAMLGVGLTTKTPTSVHIDIELVGTLPIVTIEPALLTSNTVDKVTYPKADPTTIKYVLIDTDYSTANNGDDRFIYITTSTSTRTFFGYDVWYDRQYMDIIVTPTIQTLVQNLDLLGNEAIVLAGYRLGSGKELGVIIGEMLIADNDKTSFQLPETNENIGNITYLTDFMGLNPVKNYINRYSYTDAIVNNPNGQYNVGFMRNHSEPIVIIDLGPASTLFKTFTSSDRIPLYLIYQQFITRYSLTYAGVKNPSDYHLYICLQY